MKSSDFRRQARESLNGNWGTSILAALIASLLGGLANTNGGSFSVSSGDAEQYEQLIAELGLSEEMLTTFLAIMGVFAIIGFIYAVAMIIVGSAVSVGYASYNISLINGNNTGVGTLFSRFSEWKTALCARLLAGLRIALWSLLFVIPGIIASYSYALVPHVLADNPYMTATEAINESKRLMKGNRWRLFCLEMSFIGWWFVCGLTLGIASFWVVPYTQASFAAFYREIKGETAPAV
jgi:uncharacterized membrane protein